MEFAKFVDEPGKTNLETITEVSGAEDIDTLVLPEITFRVGGFDAVLRQCPVLLQSSGLSWERGVIGMDILGKPRSVSIDFSRMHLSIE
jgi:hypothetical protein